MDYKLIFSDMINEKKKEKRLYAREYYQKHKEKYQINAREHYQKNRDSIKEYQRQYRLTHPELQKLRMRISHKKTDSNLRYLAIAHYSKGGFSCACCNENIYELLTIDHINSDGAIHRKELKTNSICRWLQKNNYPDGFQILCMNCNWGRSLQPDKICPHQKAIKEVTMNV